MNNKLILGGVVLSLVLSCVGLFRPININVAPPQVNLGATAGTTHTNDEEFLAAAKFANTTWGDSDATQRQITNASSALTAAEICSNSVIVYSDVASGATSSFPTASSVFTRPLCLTRVGDWRTVYVTVSSTNALTFVEADNASTSVYNASSTGATTNIINAGSRARLDFVRVASSGATHDPWLDVYVTPFR